MALKSCIPYLSNLVEGLCDGLGDQSLMHYISTSIFASVPQGRGESAEESHN